MIDRAYITCRQLIDIIGDFVAGELDAQSLSDFERHHVRCPSCQAYLETYRRTIQLVHSLR